MNDTDHTAKPQRKAISRLPAAPRHERCRAAVLEAECLLEGADGNRAKNAKTLRLTYAGVAAAAVMQKPPRDSALVLAELLALANDDPDLRARLDGYLGNDATERGAA